MFLIASLSLTFHRILIPKFFERSSGFLFGMSADF